jgi:hypothetical protein
LKQSIQFRKYQPLELLVKLQTFKILKNQHRVLPEGNIKLDEAQNTADRVIFYEFGEMSE